MQRIAVFVDGSNFFYVQRDGLKWWIDPKKLLDYIAQRGDITHAAYYASIDSTNAAQQSYFKALGHMGYAVETQELRVVKTPEGDRHKGNPDIDVVVGMFHEIDNYDLCVLVSGDSDFISALDELEDKGKECLIISTAGFIQKWVRETKPFLDFQSIRPEIEKVSSGSFTKAHGRAIPNS